MTSEEIARFDAMREEYRTLSRDLHTLLTRASGAGRRCIHEMSQAECKDYVRIAGRLDTLQSEINTFLLGDELQEIMRALAKKLQNEAQWHQCPGLELH